MVLNKTPNNRGGKRQGAGRPKGERNITISIKVSEANFKKLQKVKNKTEFINKLIEESG